MEKKDQIILGAAALAVLGVMLPWFQVSAFGITVSASGFKTTPGIIGLLAIGAGGYMAYKKMKEAFYAGVAACAIGLLTILDVFELTMGDFDVPNVSAKDLGKALGIDIGFGMGLYLYIAGSAAFTYFAYQDFQAKKEEN
jgi:hypothetical protein